MVTIDDIYEIAMAIDTQATMMTKRGRQDLKECVSVCLDLEPLDFQGIDEQLYENEHRTLVGYTVGDEINIKILGVNFKLMRKEAK